MHIRYAYSCLLTVCDARMTSYADKMANDKFDGTQGFSIDGGIKDARYHSSLHHITALLSVTYPQPHPAAHFGAQLPHARC